jgi:hypothetical protein
VSATDEERAEGEDADGEEEEEEEDEDEVEGTDWNDARKFVRVRKLSRTENCG